MQPFNEDAVIVTFYKSLGLRRAWAHHVLSFCLLGFTWSLSRFPGPRDGGRRGLEMPWAVAVWNKPTVGQWLIQCGPLLLRTEGREAACICLACRRAGSSRLSPARQREEREETNV